MSDWKDFTTALLGSWPSQVSAWGRDAIAAYVAELEARDVSPDDALVALRMCGDRFPPAAGELASAARRDPSRPTFDECFRQLYGPGGVFGFKRSGVTVSPWVTAFVERVGADRLRALRVDDESEGQWARKELRESYERFLEASEGRELAQIARRSRGDLGRIDPLKEIGIAAERGTSQSGKAV